jgi:hypothetical protein
LVKEKADKITRLESEIREFQQKYANLESDKNSGELAKNNLIEELVNEQFFE